jgi:hypothetical protein
MMPFEKGTSGNKQGRIAGRTPGAKLRKAIEAKADEILQAVINAAILGDMAACKMLLDRITPTLKPQALPINLVFQESLALQGNEIIKTTVKGQIAPDIGSQLISALASQTKIVEADDVIRRIEALEAQNEH